METKEEKVFKTKTGYCHILPDRIVLTRSGIVGEVANVTVGNKMARILTVYGILSFYLFYLAFESYSSERYVSTVFIAVIGCLFVYGMLNSLNNSATPVIERKKIRAVKFRKGVPGLSRSRFEIRFEEENGNIKKRLIMLPGSMSSGEDEARKAVELFRSEGML
ncbi:MAG: hypothetical protein K0S33_1421 [Bacteroidetes bacterium]|jgi:hypothetical protein|nr:hypothetical protein [Bacteroidota bacterium]